MKKLVLSFVALLVATVVCAQTLQTVTVGDLRFSILTIDNRSTAMVEGLSTTQQGAIIDELVIPSVLPIRGTSIPVLGISKEAFSISNCPVNIKKVFISYGVKSIGEKAFYGTSLLEDVFIPSSVTSVGSQAFLTTNSALKLHFAGLTPPTFASDAIREIVGYGSVRLVVPREADNIVNTYKEALSSAGISLQSGPVQGATLDILSKDKAYGYSLTGSNTNGTPNVSLTYVNPDHLISHTVAPRDSVIGNVKVFNVTEIGEWVCRDMASIEAVDLSQLQYLRYIGFDAFYGCSRLRSAKLGNTVQNIRSSSFRGTMLISVTIPASVHSIGVGAFDGKVFERYHVDEGNSVYATHYGLLYSKDLKTLCSVPAGLTQTKILNDDKTIWSRELECVESYAFYGCENLKIVHFPYGVKRIEASCMAYCSQLLSCAFPSSITDFAYPFFSCKNLTSIVLNLNTIPTFTPDPTGVTPMPELAVPFSMGRKYQAAAGWKNSPKITEGAYDFYKVNFGSTSMGFMAVISTTPEEINGKRYDGRVALSAQNSCAEAGQTMVVPDEISTIYGDKTFALTSIQPNVMKAEQTTDYTLTLGANVESIGFSAFEGQTHLTGLNLNANLQSIGASAFKDCGIKSALMFNYGIRSIDGKAFYGNKIPSIFIPASIEQFGSDCLAQNTKLKYFSLNSLDLWKTVADFTGVPKTCKFYVPTGVVEAYKNKQGWSGYDIEAGACDFTYRNAGILSTRYHTTILTTDPITFEGETYDGTAKYVYSQANLPGVITSNTIFDGGLYADYNLRGMHKRYLIVEYGDSCLYGATGIDTIPLENARALRRIGNYAFKGTRVRHITLPPLVEEIGKDAFTDCIALEEVLLSAVGEKVWKNRWYGNNSSSFTCYPRWDKLGQIQPFVANWPKTSGQTDTALDHLSAYFIEESGDTIVTFSVNLPIRWDNLAKDVWVYVLGTADNGFITCSHKKININTPPNQGLMLTHFKQNTVYKLTRYLYPNNYYSSLVGNSVEELDLDTVGTRDYPAKYWDYKRHLFVSANGSYKLPAGRAYLKPSQNYKTKVVVTELFPDAYKKGDVNLDDGVGPADILDLNRSILGKCAPDWFHGRDDINKDGKVSISDINHLIRYLYHPK